MIEIDKHNIFTLIGALGALIMIVGVFLDWVFVDTVRLGDWHMSGWDLFFNNHVDYGSGKEFDLAYNYAPIIVLVAGILGLISFALPMIKPLGIERILGLVTIIVCIVAIVFAALFSASLGDYIVFGYKFMYAGTGLTVAIIGGILAIVAPLIPVGLHILGKEL